MGVIAYLINPISVGPEMHAFPLPCTSVEVAVCPLHPVTLGPGGSRDLAMSALACGPDGHP